MSKPHITIYTDGACKGNPGPGGWGVVLRSGEHEKHLHGGAPDTTNNRMEISAVIHALKALKQGSASGSLAGKHAAGKPLINPRSRMSIFGKSSMPYYPSMRLRGIGSAGTTATPEMN
jgi:hypothetical protein